MSTRLYKMFLAFCLSIVLLPVAATAIEFTDSTETGPVIASDEATGKVEGGDYQNASDYIEYGSTEFFCNYDDEDKLYVLDKATGDMRIAVNEHIISMVSYQDYLYVLAYREETGCMLRVDMKNLDFSEYEMFPSLITSMVRRDNIIYFATSNGITSLNLDRHSRSELWAGSRVTLLYFSDSDNLKFFTDEGLLRIYSFSSNQVISDRGQDNEATLMGGYTPRLTAPDSNNPYYTTLNVFHQSGYGMFPNGGNCTCYAFGRSYENLGSEPSLSHHNAGDWYGENRSYPSNSSASNPALGAVAVWSKDKGAGHVAVVEVIDGDIITTSESGWKSFIFRPVPRNKTDSNLSAASPYHFLGYIYVLGDVPPHTHVTVRRNSTGVCVRELQVALNHVIDLGWLQNERLAEDGGFGPATEAAVRNFQRTWQLVDDGVCGPATWAALESGNPPPQSTATFDVNFILDGGEQWGEQDFGTFDVYINGALVADDCRDYCAEFPVGTQYQITDIRPTDWHKTQGVVRGSESGVIGPDTTYVFISFSTFCHLDVNGFLNGVDNGGLGDFGTVDVYINGELKADDVNDYYAEWPKGTSYEIRDIRPRAGYSYNGLRNGYRAGTLESGDTDVRFDFSNIQTGVMEKAGEATFNGNTYQFYSTRTTWFTAKQFCEEQGGHLVTVTGAEENDIVRTLTGGTDIWGGATDIDGTWRWVTGEAFEYSPWDSGEPNNASVDLNSCEDYLEIYGRGQWNDCTGCGPYSFVCEIEGDSLDVNGYLDGGESGWLESFGTVDVYINGSLVADDVNDYFAKWPRGTSYEIRDIRPNGGYTYNGVHSGARTGVIGAGTADVRLDFSRIQTAGITQAGETAYNGSTYRFYSSAVTWHTAKQFCEQQGGHLVTIGSAEENGVVQSLSGNQEVWAGGTDAGSESVWRWANGESFAYTNWTEGQPDNWSGNDEGCENYLSLYPSGTWNDYPGYTRLPFVCEIENPEHTVRFDANGGSVSTTEKTMRNGTVYGELPKASRNGYVFSGWFTEPNGGSIVIRHNIVPNQDEQTLYAHWIRVKDTPVATRTLNGHTYELFDKGKTWSEAEAFCESREGHLVTITSEQEQKLVEELLEEGAMHQYWIGLTSTSGNLCWVTSEDYAYDHWDAGEPNYSVRADGTPENYVHIYNVANPVSQSSQRFGWNDIFEDGTYPNEEEFFSTEFVGYICETEAPPAPTLTSISIVSLPNKTVYNVGEQLNTSGLRIRADYSDGSSETLSSGFTVSGFDSSSEGIQTITVTYEGKTATFDVAVRGEVSPDAVQLMIEAQTVTPGSTFDVPILLKNNPGLTGFAFGVRYDADKLELLNVKDGDYAGATAVANISESPVFINYSIASKTNRTEETLAVMTFKAKESAVGEAALTVQIDMEFGDEFLRWDETRGTSVNFASEVYQTGGSIKIREAVPGDTDGSGKVTLSDAQLIQQYLARWKIQIDLDVADVDASGKVTLSDVQLIQQYLARWKVQLLPGKVSEGTATLSAVDSDDYAVLQSADSPEIVIEPQTVSAGSTFDVPILLKNNPGLTGFAFGVEYDAEKLELVEARDGDYSGATEVAEIAENPVFFNYSIASKTNKTGETLVILSFKAKENASGDANISILIDLEFGDEFLHWDSDKGVAVNFANEVLTTGGSIGIRTSTQSSHTVMFNVRGGSAVENQIVGDGEKVQKPDDPVKGNFVFAYWTLNGKEFNFNSPVTSDMTLVAEWIPEEVSPEIKGISLTKKEESGIIVSTIIASVNCADTTATIYCTGYNAEGQAFFFSSEPITGKQNYEFRIRDNRFSYAKVFIVGEDYIPLCASKRS